MQFEGLWCEDGVLKMEEQPVTMSFLYGLYLKTSMYYKYFENQTLLISDTKKTLLLSIESWLFNRDPCNALS